ncbi:MAG: acetylxylan esterase [Muribaculaceae bacterium]|nr:acetylxylan esterase [Muribaculaceae bacterium]
MRKNIFTLLSAALLSLGLTAGLHAEKKGKAEDLTPYFTASTSKVGKPDTNGFIRRWLLLEPIEKPNRTNTVFTDSYLREVFNTEYFPGQFSHFPKNGEKVKVGKQKLQWHSLDSELFNVKLFRFATKLDKPYYGVLFWVVTAIDCEEDIPDVRMSVGSNSASMWWLNGEEAVLLSGDRRMVQDDCMSHRLTLKKGRNIVRGAIINGPGMSDFCLRFLNEQGQPVTNFTVSTL